MLDLIQIVQPQHTVLVVVDMQNDYCHAEGVCASKGDDVSSVTTIIPRLTVLIAAARRSGTNVIFVRTTHDKWTDSPARKALPRYQDWSAHLCQTGTWGAEFFGVSPKSDDYVITKHRNSAFIDTPLDLVLRSLETETIIVTGVATHVCVDCTVRDGFQRDYFVIVPADCTDTATSNRQLKEATLVNIDGRWGKVVASDEILQAWTSKEVI